MVADGTIDQDALGKLAQAEGTPVVLTAGPGEEGFGATSPRTGASSSRSGPGHRLGTSPPMTTDVASGHAKRSRPRHGRGRLRARPPGDRVPADAAVLRLRDAVPVAAHADRRGRSVPDRHRAASPSTTSGPCSPSRGSVQAFGRSIQLSARDGAARRGARRDARLGGRERRSGRLAAAARHRLLGRARPVRRRDARVRVPRRIRIQRPGDDRPPRHRRARPDRRTARGCMG